MGGTTYKGSNELSAIYVGNKEIVKAYCGTKIVWDSFEYDYVDTNNYDEIDFIYTTDIHGCWLGYQTSPRGVTTAFAYHNTSYYNVATYKSTLESSGSIKALCVDGGDWSHYTGDDRLINVGYGIDAVNAMNTVGYFAVTMGNHEYKTDISTSFMTQIMPQLNNSCACNLLVKSTGETALKPYRTAKIGNKKIAIIGVAFSGPDGDTTAWTNLYDFIDSTELYELVQTYIDFFKRKNFDYIGVLPHLGASPDGSRSYASSTLIIQNTSGLDFIFLAHSHNWIENGYTINDKDGNPVHVCAQPRCDFGYMSRLRLTSSGISSSTLTSY